MDEHYPVLPTGKDVARQAGVSVTTVSRVLNNMPNVRPEVRDRVLQTVNALNYRPSRTARRLRARHSTVLGLLIPDIQNPFFTAIARGIEDVAYQHDHSVVLCNSDEDPNKERLYINMMCAEDVAGVILVTTSGSSEHLNQLWNRGIPVVAIDRQLKDRAVDSTLVSNEDGAFEAVSHLIGLGHRRIGFIGLPLSLTVGSERYCGYVRALEQHGLMEQPELVRIGDTKQCSGLMCARELLDLKPPVTALFVANNLKTLGALEAVHERNLTIPADVSIVGFDDFPLAAYLEPPLTTVTQPTYELGRSAVTLLLERIENPQKPVEHVRLRTTLNVRSSTGAPRVVEPVISANGSSVIRR